jgi:hypothetical protein
MASFGVDRYGRPLGYDQQANPYNDQKENNPASSQPDQNTSQQSGQFASSGGSFGMPGTTQNPNTGISPPPAPAPAPTQAPPRADYPQAPAPTAPAGGQYNTDGYAQPGYVASNYGQAPAGWDATKWNDPNYQTPKYTVGRILTEAGNLADPTIRNTAIQRIQQAYPGAQFDGKDKISIDGGRSWVDIFGGSGAGIYSPAWMPVEQGAEALRNRAAWRNSSRNRSRVVAEVEGAMVAPLPLPLLRMPSTSPGNSRVGNSPSTTR